jgi:hypothetical protein
VKRVAAGTAGFSLGEVEARGGNRCYECLTRQTVASAVSKILSDDGPFGPRLSTPQKRSWWLKSSDMLPCKIAHAQDGDANNPGRK